MGFVVLHLLKPVGTDASMTAHIERTVAPNNADPSLTHLNRSLIEYPDGVNDRTEAIQHRLDTAGLTRKIGKNQRTAFNVMLSGTPEDMKRIEAAGNLDQWCDDNLEWLRKTYGTENVVSAVLHLDEKTPHIHATVVPIVTTERRKKKSELQAKKRYRTKSRNAARLCVDDVMSRDKLKEYQTTYAEAMAKYGLQRGIDGSEARHISTSQWYRDLSVKNESLKESVEQLLEQQEQAKQELDKVRSAVSKEKFKNSAADVGASIMDGMGSLLGSSKAKRLQNEVEELKAENAELKDSLGNEIKQLKLQLRTTEAEHAKITDKLRQELKKIYDLFPDIRELLNIERLCKAVGFPDDMVKRLLNKEPVGFSGKLYSAEYQRTFETQQSVAKVEPDPTQPGKLHLTIDGVGIVGWFRQQYKEFQKAIGINIDPKQGKGIRR